MNAGRILVVDDEKIAVRNLEHILKKEGYAVTATQSGAQALHYLEQQPFELVLTDLRMEKVDGLKVLAYCQDHLPDVEVIVITGFSTIDSAIEVMKKGAFYYLAKPFRLEEVRKVVAEAMAKVQLKLENKRLREQMASYQLKVRPITQNPAMLKLLETARQIAASDCNVLITGESGTGKELLAKYLHAQSDRRQAPYLAVNCGAFNEELLANELFGHEKGAFTGAVSSKPGLLEAAAGGTLLLDEITEMPLSMQVKLLRVIQEREILRLGSTQPTRIDVRFVAATNRDLRQLVQDGRFRQDLYFRINVVNLHIPPLASRREDIPLLAAYFLQKYATALRRNIQEISAAAMDILENYHYPGNVRELENIIERGVALATGETLNVAHLSDELRKVNVRTFARQDGKIPSLEDVERDYIYWVLDEARGNQSVAASIIGIDRVSLWRKLKRFQPKD